MVYKLAGWIITYEQGRQWIQRSAPDDVKEALKGLSNDGDIPYLIRNWLMERKAPGQGLPDIAALHVMGTDYPRYSEQAYILLGRKESDDPKSTVRRYRPIAEIENDLAFRPVISQETGIPAEELKWVTIVDPFWAER